MIRVAIVSFVLFLFLGLGACIGASEPSEPVERDAAGLKRDCGSDEDCGIYCPSCGRGTCGGEYYGECYCDQDCW